MTKERRQVLILQVVLGLTALVMLYIYKDAFVPNPLGGTPPAPATGRIPVGISADRSLYEREDFKALRRFGDLPVKPLRSGGTAEPFITEATP